MRLLQSLTVKLIFAFILMLGLITGLIFFYTYQSSKQALFGTLQESLKDIAAASASQINGDVVESFKPGDESSPQFTAMRDQLLAMRKNNSDIHYSYIMKPSGNDVAFVVDDTYGKEEGAAAIGEIYKDTEDPTRQSQDNKEILSGLKGPAAGSALYTDQWGDFLSGYAPVVDSQGKTVAVFGLDMDASEVTTKEDFIGHQIYLVLAIIFVFATLIVAYFAWTISRDIRMLNAALIAIAERKGQTKFPTDVKRKDEIGQLADTIRDMESNIWTTLSGPPKF